MKGSLVILFVLTIVIVHSSVEGKIFGRCEAVKELQKARISRSFLSNWVCLMESESGMNTALMTGPKTASSYSYGILQINSAKWCARGRAGGNCSKRCEDFLSDDIQDDIACAKKVFDQDGFKAWDGWMKKCKNKPLPDISNCIRRRRMAENDCNAVGHIDCNRYEA
ncbi:Lysozyme c-1 [Cyphomyrmex costatus]|uniref:lysozyme n=1 Tax=Cyphomyrmex costatus TaxID=456900 RepID=A0A151ILU5_9HYME|nr:Lysozyme c-1 [Cyphomyrmex costatus]